MHCSYFEKQICLSCSLLDVPYDRQLIDKMDELTKSLNLSESNLLLDPVRSPEKAFRNKAKMVAMGELGQVVLGITNHNKIDVELVNCPLYPKKMQLLLVEITKWINAIGLSSYDVNQQRGELKFVLLTMTTSEEFLLRFVLNSEAEVKKIKVNVKNLLATQKMIKVCSINIQPIHMAILEGDKEIYLTEQTFMRERLNEIPLYFGAKTFFQTNSEITKRLYQSASSWVSELDIICIWDLFCGVGGFGLSCYKKNASVLFIEIFEEAKECLKRSTEEMKITNSETISLDLIKANIPKSKRPDLVILNPPRRGCGEVLLNQINGKILPNFILYSSCNYLSLKEDLRVLSNYKIKKIQLFDMFPHTKHFETLVLLEKVI